MNILGIIPARGGSKGIPRKNIRPVLGLPLIGYTIRSAQESRLLTDCIVSTEDSEIALIAEGLGASVPFVRPSDLATDTATSIDVLKHGLAFMEDAKKIQYDYLMMLQVTAPLRTAEDIDAAIERLLESDADAIVSVCRVDDPHPGKMMRVQEGQLSPFCPELWHERVRRQELPPVYFLNGAIYLVRTSVLREQDSIWGKKTLALEMPPERSVNIDAEMDLIHLETVLKKG